MQRGISRGAVQETYESEIFGDQGALRRVVLWSIRSSARERFSARAVRGCQLSTQLAIFEASFEE